LPELPDIEAYCAALRPRLIGGRLEEIDLRSAFLLRSVEPPVAAGRAVWLARLDPTAYDSLHGGLESLRPSSRIKPDDR
jgi:hypothetical protein